MPLAATAYGGYAAAGWQTDGALAVCLVLCALLLWWVTAQNARIEGTSIDLRCWCQCVTAAGTRQSLAIGWRQWKGWSATAELKVAMGCTIHSHDIHMRPIPPIPPIMLIIIIMFIMPPMPPASAAPLPPEKNLAAGVDTKAPYT
jgi:hypothetical protein